MKIWIRRLKFMGRHPRLGLYAFLTFIFPINKKRIVLCNFYGNGYGDNPKYITEEIIRRNLLCDKVWLVNKHWPDIPDQIRQVKLNSLFSAYILSTAKVIIINSRGPFPFFKKQDQFLIQTWHSLYGPKYVEKDAIKSLPKRYIKDSIDNSLDTDVFLSPCDLQSKEFRDAFWCTCEIMESGIPRNDIYFNVRKETINSIKSKIGVPNNAKIVMYAPTFRDDGDTDVFEIDIERLRKTIEQKYNQECYALIRLHPKFSMEKVKLHIFEAYKTIDVTKYSDIQELLLVTDILITDYSSIMFDFALMKKPVFLYIPDVHKTTLRGIRPMFFKFPFAHCESFEELILEIKNFENSKYQSNLQKFMRIFKSFDNGNASVRVVDRIQSLL